MKPHLSVIIPAFNEEDNLRRGSLSVVIDYLSSQKFSWEIILVNDGSSDQTLALLQGYVKSHSRLRLIDNPHYGKAQTVNTGVLAAVGDYIVFTDMDQATPISELPKLLSRFTKGYDVVIGSRANREGAPVFRQILAYGMIIIRTLLLQLPIRDTQCGFKAFSAASARKVFSLLNRLYPPVPVSGPAVNAGWDVEMLYLSRKFGYKIAEVPVAWRYQESRRVNFFKDIIRSLRELLLVRYRSLTNAYQV